MCSRLSYHLPNLHNVVFRHGTDDPGLIGVPGEVRDLGCVTSMDKLDKEKPKTPFNYNDTRWCYWWQRCLQAYKRLTSSSGGPSSASSGDCSSPILLQYRQLSSMLVTLVPASIIVQLTPTFPLDVVIQMSTEGVVSLGRLFFTALSLIFNSYFERQEKLL